MKNEKNLKAGISRRRFLGNTAAMAAFSMVPASRAWGNSSSCTTQKASTDS